MNIDAHILYSYLFFLYLWKLHFFISTLQERKNFPLNKQEPRTKTPVWQTKRPQTTQEGGRRLVQGRPSKFQGVRSHGGH